MDAGQLVYIISRLVLGALTAFFAIMLWSKTRDTAWMLIVLGAIAAYVETVYSVLELCGITGNMAALGRSSPGSMSPLAILLSNLPTVFFLISFVVMVIRKYRKS